MAIEQVRQGHRVDILTTGVVNPLEAKKFPSKLPKIQVHSDGYRILRVRNLSNAVAYHWKLHLAPELLSFFFHHAHKYDVIHLHEYRTTLNFAAAFFKWRTRARFLLQPHGVFQNFGGREIFKQIFDFFCKKTIDESVDHLLAISQKEATILEQHFPDLSTHLIYHGITKPPAAKNQPLIDLPKKFLLFVGRIHQVKNLDILVKAYTKSNLRKKNIHLVIAGNDDGYLRELQKLVVQSRMQTYIHYVGPVNIEEKFQLFRQALLNVYVTQDEPFGRVPLEAASVGCWSIISRTSGVAELQEKIDFADCVGSESISELASAMTTAIKRKKHVSLTDRKAILRLTWKKQAKLLEKVCRLPRKLGFSRPTLSDVLFSQA
jgi:glycosyltransferase involved in cell wall biosynthesis